jgi:hypothetical protein
MADTTLPRPRCARTLRTALTAAALLMGKLDDAPRSPTHKASGVRH